MWETRLFLFFAAAGRLPLRRLTRCVVLTIVALRTSIQTAVCAPLRSATPAAPLQARDTDGDIGDIAKAAWFEAIEGDIPALLEAA
ncbi:hypothetical protein LDO31_14430 [Luteimonas sp. XNQY3]|nr:hypothetical protein [Luteimonas sp. XNQY3]MCD9007413.1 hypothetical protein [Luteimonas sp. XNQY3]